MPSHELRDCRLSHRDSQLLQLAMNPRRTAEAIRGRQCADQSTDVCRHAWPSGAPAAVPGPELTKATSVPGEDGRRLDDVQRRSPRAPGPREPRPQQPVCRRQTQSSVARSMEHCELVSKREDFDVQATRATGLRSEESGAARRRRRSPFDAIQDHP